MTFNNKRPKSSKFLSAIAKTILPILFIFSLQFNAQGNTWGSGDFTVSYNECTGKVTAKLLNFFSDCGTCDDDYLGHSSFYLWINGAWVEIAYSSGSDSGCSGGIASARNGYAITSNYSGSCNSKEYVEVHLLVPNDILNSTSGVVKIRVDGKAYDDASPDTEFNWNKEASIPSIADISGFSVSTDECEKVTLSWNAITIPACLDNATNREVQIRKDGNYLAYVASGNTYIDNNVQNGAEHDYQVGIRYYYNSSHKKDGPLATSLAGNSIPDPQDPNNFTVTTDN